MMRSFEEVLYLLFVSSDYHYHFNDRDRKPFLKSSKGLLFPIKGEKEKKKEEEIDQLLQRESFYLSGGSDASHASPKSETISAMHHQDEDGDGESSSVHTMMTEKTDRLIQLGKEYLIPGIQAVYKLNDNAIRSGHELDLTSVKPRFQEIINKYKEFYESVLIKSITSDTNIARNASTTFNAREEGMDRLLLIKFYVFKILFLASLLLHDYFHQDMPTMNQPTISQRKEQVLKDLFPYWEDLFTSPVIQQALHYHFQLSPIGRLMRPKAMITQSASYLFLFADFQNCYWKLFPKPIDPKMSTGSSLIKASTSSPNPEASVVSTGSASFTGSTIGPRANGSSLISLEELKVTDASQSTPLYQQFPAVFLAKKGSHRSSEQPQQNPSSVHYATNELQLHRIKPLILTGHSNMITCMTISQGRLYTGSKDGTVCIWDLVSTPIPTTPLAVLQRQKYGINCLTILHGYLYVGSDDCYIYIWNISQSPIQTAPIGLLFGHTDWIHQFLSVTIPSAHPAMKELVTPDILFTASADHSIRVWNLTLHHYPVEDVMSLVFPDEEEIVANNSSLTFETNPDDIHNHNNNEEASITFLSKHHADLIALEPVLHPASENSNNSNKRASLKERISKAAFQSLPVGSIMRPTTTATNTTTPAAASASQHRRPHHLLVIRDTIATLTHHTQWITSMVYNPERQLFFSSSYDQSIKVYVCSNWLQLRLLCSLNDHMGMVHSLLVCEDRLYSCGGDWVIKIWDLLSILHAERNPDPDPDPSRPLIGWEIQPLTTLCGHHSWVTVLAISLEYGLLFSGGYDSEIYVWEISSFPVPVTPIAILQGHRAAITSLMVNQHRLYSSSVDGKLKVWEIANLSLHQRQQIRQTRVTLTPFRQSSTANSSSSHRFSQLERPSQSSSSMRESHLGSLPTVNTRVAPNSPGRGRQSLFSTALSTSVAVDYSTFEVIQQSAISTLTTHRKAIQQLLISHGRLISASKDGVVQIRCL